MEALPRAAIIAGREVALVVATHLGRDAGDVIPPASQNLADHWVNACAHKLQTDALGRRILSGQHQPVLQQRLLRAKSILSHAAGHFRMIILFGQMRQHYVRCASIIIFRKKLGEGVVGEVPDPAHHPLLDRPRIRPYPQHFKIVVGFDDDDIATAQVVAHAGRHVGSS